MSSVQVCIWRTDYSEAVRLGRGRGGRWISVAVNTLPSVAYEPTVHASVADSTAIALRLLRKVLAFELGTTVKPQPDVVTEAWAGAGQQPRGWRRRPPLS
jgi:hypothetical protein